MHKIDAYELYRETLRIIRTKLFEANDCKCYICGKTGLSEKMTSDHVFPDSRGYTLIGNLMPAHQKCNSKKGNRQPTEEEIQSAQMLYQKVGMTFKPSKKKKINHIGFYIECAYPNTYAQ